MEQGQRETAKDLPSSNLRGALDQIKIIATGGMSEIFRARQPSLDRYIVVKKLKDGLLRNPETAERFRREAKALASVLHQNIAHVYDFVDTEEPYILMEYIDGIDVSHAIEKLGHLPPIIAASILLGVAKGLSYIHAHHLIHRDIKPSNIRLTTRGEVKLMDFGIVVDLENASLTRPGLMVGSPSYLSPEQVLGDPITPQSDIFLMGICFYEMLTGTRPFKEEGGETVFQRIRETQYVPVRQMQSQIPLGLDHIVKKCLRKEPAKRFLNVKELILSLERFLGAEVSTHTEDLILKFLDEEALLKVTAPYSPVVSRRARLRDTLSRTQFIGLSLTLILLGLATFFAGYHMGSLTASQHSPTRPAMNTSGIPQGKSSR